MGGSGVSAYPRAPPARPPSLALGPGDTRPAILPRGHRSSRSLSPDSTPRSLAYVRQATGPGMPRPRAKSARLGGVSVQHADLRHSAAPFWATRVRTSPRCSWPNPTAQKFERTRDPIPFSMRFPLCVHWDGVRVRQACPRAFAWAVSCPLAGGLGGEQSSSTSSGSWGWGDVRSIS